MAADYSSGCPGGTFLYGTCKIYLYKIRAIGPPATSAFSAIDLATTTVFLDPDLTGQTIKTDHILQARTAINAMRFAANLIPTTFTDSSLTEVIIKGEHITQARASLDQAREALGVAKITDVDSITPGVTVA